MFCSFKFISVVTFAASSLLGLSAAQDYTPCQIIPDYQKGGFTLGNSYPLNKDPSNPTSWRAEISQLGVIAEAVFQSDGTYFVSAKQANGGKDHYMLVVQNKGEDGGKVFIRIDGSSFCQNVLYAGSPAQMSLAVIRHMLK